MLFILAGAFAGTLSGLLGVGGGMVIVPTLNYIFDVHMSFADEMVMHLATGTSLCIMMFTSSTSVYAQWHSSWRARKYFREFFPYFIAGIVTGALLADVLSSFVLRKIFGFFVLFVVLEMQYGRRLWRKRIKVSHNQEGVIIGCIGAVSGLLGIGGAILLYPFLTRKRMTLRKITHVSALASLTAGVMGTLTVMLAGGNHPYIHRTWSIGYVYLPAVVFAAIPSMLVAKFAASKAQYVPIRYLKLFFILFLVATGLRMIW